jgi:hypothetical protein
LFIVSLESSSKDIIKTQSSIMQAADTPQVEEAIQRALADESQTQLCIWWEEWQNVPLTVIDARCIIECPLCVNANFFV